VVVYERDYPDKLSQSFPYDICFVVSSSPQTGEPEPWATDGAACMSGPVKYASLNAELLTL